LIDEGHVKGKNFVQVGLHSISPGGEAMEWMRKNQIRYHTMAEIDKKGWDAVMKKVLAEALDGPEYIFLSIDLDCLEPAFAPGMGTPEPGGMSPTELMKLVRGLSAQNKIVGIDLVEVNPIVDQSYLTPLVALRTLGEAMTGIAMRKKGITDPLYADPKWVDHDVPMDKKAKK
jgi:agmatinase